MLFSTMSERFGSFSLYYPSIHLCALLEHEHSNTRKGGWDRVERRRRCGRLTHEVIVIVRSMLCVEWNIYNSKLIYTDESFLKNKKNLFSIEKV